MFEPRKFSDIKIGERASIKRSYNERDVELFIAVSQDYNPIHCSEEYAKTTRFGRRIVPGLLTASMISGVLGTKLPGYGTIYMSQELKFHYPVYFGDELECEVEVIDKIEAKKIIILDARIKNNDGKIVVSGKAIVMLES
ncbi:MAG: MaoC family dehydratase [Deltaproteobacteria bacterium]|nr:MaoC family dehydratase [Deltaproteobacteria bacterium]